MNLTQIKPLAFSNDCKWAASRIDADGSHPLKRNVGAAVTKFTAPLVLVALGWTAVAQIWAAALAIFAVLFLRFPRELVKVKRVKRHTLRPRWVFDCSAR